MHLISFALKKTIKDKNLKKIIFPDLFFGHANFKIIQRFFWKIKQFFMESLIFLVENFTHLKEELNYD